MNRVRRIVIQVVTLATSDVPAVPPERRALPPNVGVVNIHVIVESQVHDLYVSNHWAGCPLFRVGHLSKLWPLVQTNSAKRRGIADVEVYKTIARNHTSHPHVRSASPFRSQRPPLHCPKR